MASIPVKQLQTAVLNWYKTHGRHDLPWRNLEKSKIDVPYGVMVSEFMLQQTQVDRVVPKYRAFLHYYPTVQKLAAATPAMVVTLWSGLGYNRRAIMLHKAAQEIVKSFGGQIPHDIAILQGLSGIGSYTAAAIASFGYNEPVVVIDTNVERFYELLWFGYTKPTRQELAELAEKYLPKVKSQAWHAALMDVMSIVRKAKSPKQQQEVLLHELKLVPTWKLPQLSSQALVRPKQSTFKHSKRYYRGKIIALLRHDADHQVTYNQLTRAMQQELLPPEYSLLDVLAGLKKDGLVIFNDPLKPRSVIKLP